MTLIKIYGSDFKSELLDSFSLGKSVGTHFKERDTGETALKVQWLMLWLNYWSPFSFPPASVPHSVEIINCILKFRIHRVH